MQADDAVRAVVAVADGDALGVEQDEGGVQGGEAGGVGQGVGVEEGGEEGFEPGGVGCGFARVDVFVEGVDLVGLVELVWKGLRCGGLVLTYIEVLGRYQVLWLGGISEGC